MVLRLNINLKIRQPVTTIMQCKLLSHNSTEESVVVTEPEDNATDEKQINVNKSRLLPQHRNKLLDKMPYKNQESWIHLTEKYQRKMFGQYGFESGINPRICFPIQSDIDEQREYEKIKYPYTIPDMVAKIEKDKDEKRLKIERREEEIANKLEKLEIWEAELRGRIEKNEAQALAVKQRKERLIEEVRRHFGFKVNPKEERFKEMLEQKEKEEKKLEKVARKKAKEAKIMEQLLSKHEKDDNKVLDKK